MCIGPVSCFSVTLFKRDLIIHFVSPVIHLKSFSSFLMLFFVGERIGIFRLFVLLLSLYSHI